MTTNYSLQKNGPIFLNGGGGSDDSRFLDIEFLHFLKNKKILYIPIALKRDDIGFETCYDWITKTFSAISEEFVDIDMMLDLNNKKIEDLLRYDALYFGGGNTYKLLNEIRTTAFDEQIIKFTNIGKCFYGGSAGAILAGKSIDTAQFADKNEVKLENTNGLSLLNGYSVWCHYKPLDDQNIQVIIGENLEKIVALTEKSGLIIINGEAKVVGTEAVASFINLKKTIYAPGETFLL